MHHLPPVDASIEHHDVTLNKLGNDNWELVSIAPVIRGGENAFVAYLKRPISR